MKGLGMNGYQELLNKRFQANMSRVTRLINLGTRLKETRGQNPGPDEAAALTDRPDEVADLYRSTVVFLHASFEDMLRTTADNRLGRAAKRTFGSVDVVVKLLRELGLDPAPFRRLFPEMKTLMNRRHRIVHEADLPAPDAVTDIPWTIGDDYQLAIWLFVVLTFKARLTAELDPSQIVDGWFADERTGILQKLIEARQTLMAADSFEEKKRRLQAMTDTLAEVLTIMKRPSNEIARTIADNHGIPSLCVHAACQTGDFP
jgi:hypothetical protein